jgi:hypothetical protein
MAIGTAAAIGIGLAGAGSAASAISGNSASRRAARTSQANTDANVALARDIYGQNRQIMSPFVNRGNAAGNQINALLGLGGSQEMGGPATMAMPNALAQFGGYNPTGSAGGSPVNLVGVNWGPSDGRYTMGYGDWVNQNMGYTDAGMPYGIGDTIGNAYGSIQAGMGDMTGTSVGGFQVGTPGYGDSLPGQTARQAAESAFDLFRNSTGYQNRFNSAMEGVTGAYSGIGAFQSGAAARALQDRAGQVAGEEFANYANMLGGQQAVGAGSASALAGVGQNFAGTVIGANNFNAQNQMSAQLGRQNPLANFAGVLGGGLFSYGAGR